MNIKKISNIFLLIMVISFLIGLIAGIVTLEAEVDLFFMKVSKFADWEIAISFLIPWLTSIVFGIVFYFQRKNEKL